MPISSFQRSLSARLDEEWMTIRTRPPLVARARAWAVTDVPFEDLDELLVLAGYRVESTPEGNDVLARLVAIARTDELATRIVLQRVLPGLLAIVRRRREPGGTHGAFEELIGAAWLAIRSCGGERQPEHVAAAIVRDAAYRAFVAPVRRLAATEVSVDPRTLEETPFIAIISPCEELATLLGDARTAGLPGRDLDLLGHLARAGSPSIVAADRKVSTRTVRNHRDRATARLRRFALAA
jgi:hypothetical protein